MISKESLRKKIKKPIDVYNLKLIIANCEEVKLNSLKHLSKDALVERAYKSIENYKLLNLLV